MIAVKLTVADLYQRRACVEDVERQLRLDNPHDTEAEIEIRLRKYALAADMCRVSHAQTRAWNWTAAGRALNGAYLALGEAPPHRRQLRGRTRAPLRQASGPESLATPPSTRKVAVEYPIGHRCRHEGIPLLEAKFCTNCS